MVKRIEIGMDLMSRYRKKNGLRIKSMLKGKMGKRENFFMNGKVE